MFLHVPDWQPRVLLGMVEARSVNVKKTTTTTFSQRHEPPAVLFALYFPLLDLHGFQCHCGKDTI